jgi:hypothetical protein
MSERFVSKEDVIPRARLLFGPDTRIARLKSKGYAIIDNEGFILVRAGCPSALLEKIERLLRNKRAHRVVL